MSKDKFSKGNPNATFIAITIENKRTLAYVDTGATMCFGKKKLLRKWDRLEKPLRIVVADKSVHELWYVGTMVPIYIERIEFIAPTIYMHDSGIDMIIGNNFLKLNQPFIQTNDTVSLRHFKTKTMVITPIVRQHEIIRMLAQNIKFNLEILLTIKREHIEEVLKEVCSENPLDTKNTNNQLVSIRLKDPQAEINVTNKMSYSIRDVKEFTEECQQLLEKGIIRNSTSPHSAPAFYVENKNEIKRGQRRMVINYKK